MNNRTLSWARLSAEFVVIVIGVLAALAVDQWRNALDDRALELEYAGRLKADLAADTLRFSEFETPLTLKIGLLVKLLESGGVPPPVEDANAMMYRLRYSTYVAIPESQSETFREMESSGTLGLLSHIGLRGSLAGYYAGHRFMSDILSTSFGGYRELVTGALPGGLWYESQIDSTVIDPIDLEHGLRVLVTHPELESAVNSELAYATSMTFYLRQFRAQAEDLLAQLEAEYPE